MGRNPLPCGRLLPICCGMPGTIPRREVTEVNVRRSSIAALLALPVALALTACGPGEPAPAPTKTATLTPSTSPSATPTPTPTASLPDDVVMVVTAVATADNGSVMDLSLTIHRPTAWDDPAAAASPALMTDVCAGSLDDGVYEIAAYGFASIDFVAVQRAGADWPTDHRLFLTPNAAYMPVATDGFPMDDDEVDPATPHCKREKFFEGPGTGTVVLGFRDDATTLTRWATHNFGFSVVRVAAQTAASVGMSLTGCHVLVTPSGEAAGGNAPGWSSRVDDTHCIYGSLQEVSDF